jgi:hypothetical protein
MASSVFGKLRTKVWDRTGLKTATKLKVYRSIVIPTMLYTCETWTFYSRHARKLNHFHMNCLRRLLKRKWRDKVPDTEVLTRAKLPFIFMLLQKAQVKWAGHIVRMPDEHIPKQLMYGEFSKRKCHAGGQKKHFKDSLKVSLKSLSIDINSWQTLAQNRPE